MNIQTLLPDGRVSNEKCGISILDEFFKRVKCKTPSVGDLSFKGITLVYQATEKFPAENTGRQTTVNMGKLTPEHRAQAGVGKRMRFSIELTTLWLLHVINSDNCEKP